MSMDKAIAHGKEHRKPYHGAKAFDLTCRNHGDDYWFRDNRTYSGEHRKPVEDEETGE